jgi:hypothetical protein
MSAIRQKHLQPIEFYGKNAGGLPSLSIDSRTPDACALTALGAKDEPLYGLGCQESDGFSPVFLAFLTLPW